MSVIVPSTVVDVESSPLTDDLWGLAYLFLANWRVDLTLAHTFTTDVVAGESVAEARSALVIRPARTLTIGLLGFDRDDSVALQMLLYRMAQARSLVPLYMDATKLTASASGTTLDCDTTNRRFYAGARVVVASMDPHEAQYSAFEVATIDSVTPTQITLKVSLSGSYPIGSRVMPLIEARVVLTESWVHLTDKGTELQVTAFETVGEMTLPPTTTAGVDPSGYPVDNGLPIMDRRFDWTSAVTGGVQREGSITQVGRGSIAQTYGERARALASGMVTSTDRDGIFKALRFFESRAGRLHPFWLFSPTDTYEAVAIDESEVEVVAVGPEFDWNFRPYIGILMNDGTRYVRGVETVSRLSGIDTVNFDSDLPVTPALSDVRSVRVVHRCRFSEDSFSERWVTDQLSMVELPMVEVLEEKAVVVENVEDNPSGRAPLAVTSGGISGGLIWPCRPWQTSAAPPAVTKLTVPTITEYVKGGSADRIGNRMLFGPFASARCVGAWVKGYTDHAGTFDLIVRLEEEATGDVLAEATLDETDLLAGSVAAQLENFAYIQFDAPATVIRDTWYRVTVEATAWADWHQGLWAGVGRTGYHVAERVAGVWTPDTDDVLGIAMILDAGPQGVWV